MTKTKLERAREEARKLQEARAKERLTKLSQDEDDKNMTPIKRKAPVTPKPLLNEKKSKPLERKEPLQAAKDDKPTRKMILKKTHKRKTLVEMAIDQAKQNKKVKTVKASTATEDTSAPKRNPELIGSQYSTSPNSSRRLTSRIKSKPRRRITKQPKFSQEKSHHLQEEFVSYRPGSRRNKFNLNTLNTKERKRQTSNKPIRFSDVGLEDFSSTSPDKTSSNTFCSHLQKAGICSVSIYIFGLAILFMLDYVHQLSALELIGIDAPLLSEKTIQARDMILPLLETGVTAEHESEILDMLQDMDMFPIEELLQLSTEHLVQQYDVKASQVVYWKKHFEKLTERAKSELLGQQIKDLAQKIQQLNRNVEQMQSMAFIYLIAAGLGGWFLGPILL